MTQIAMSCSSVFSHQADKFAWGQIKKAFINSTSHVVWPKHNQVITHFLVRLHMVYTNPGREDEMPVALHRSAGSGPGCIKRRLVLLCSNTEVEADGRW